MKTLSQRKSEAKERQEAHDSLTTAQKILKLDLKLGGGRGAVKQREKLAQILVKETEGRVPKVIAGPVDAINGEFKKKPYQKPKKS